MCSIISAAADSIWHCLNPWTNKSKFYRSEELKLTLNVCV